MYTSESVKTKSALYSTSKPLLSNPRSEPKEENSSFIQILMSRAKLITILTFVIGHVIAASGNVEIFVSQTKVLGSSRIGQASLLLPLEDSESFMVQAGQPLILHPTWYSFIVILYLGYRKN